MRLYTTLPILLMIIVTCLPSCTRSVPQNTTGTTSGGNTILPPASKYVVDTYDGDGPLSIINIDPLVQSTGYFSGSFDKPGCLDDPLGSGDPSLTFPGNLGISPEDQIFIGDYGCGKAKVAGTTGHSAAIFYYKPENLDPDMSNVYQDFAGNIFIGDTHNGIFEISANDQILVSLLSGNDIGIISSMTMDADQKNIFISAKHAIQEISDGKATIIAGSDKTGSMDGAGKTESFGSAMAICMGGHGAGDNGNNLIRRIAFSR